MCLKPKGRLLFDKLYLLIDKGSRNRTIEPNEGQLVGRTRMTWQYLTWSPLALSESSHHTYHTYHALVWVTWESFAKRTLLDIHMWYCSTHIFHCSTASPDVRAVGLPESTDKHLHVTLTTAHNLQLPIRRLITVLSLGCERNLHAEYLPWNWDTGESISFYIQQSISQSSHCGGPTNKTSSLFFSVFQLRSPS